MKFALLTTKLGIFSIIGFSLCATNGLATNTNTGVLPGKAVQLQAPPTPKSVTPAANQAKPVAKPAEVIQGGEQVVLQSRDIGSLGPKWQSFSDYLTVAKGCDQIPLYLTFTNGPAPTLRFQDLRIYLAGKPIATIKDFNDQAVLTRNLSRALGVGDSLLTVQALGRAGAKLNWQFTTPKIVVTKVNPNSFGPTDKIIVEGRNFSDRPNVSQVFIGSKPATVVSARSNSLEIKLPSGIIAGKASLYVVVGTQKSNSIEVTVKGAPEIEGVSMVSTAPGQPLTITGRGFSPLTGENTVTIGGYQAEVTSAGPTSIQCIVPLGLDSVSPAWDLPVKVKTNGMDSTDPYEKGRINIQLRVFNGD